MKLPTWPEPKSIEKIYLGLERMNLLLEKLGNPQDKLPPVFHIAGTNGKGSTTAFLKSILEKNGYTVHRYTSPHLVRFNERIEIYGDEITDKYYYELANECREIIDKYNLDVSYFEITTAIALMAFSRNKADAVILEVGMGGRLDATNVIKNPLTTLITPISLDHVKALGDTVEKIAVEKFGIVKKNCNLILSKQEQNVTNLLINMAKKLPCPVYAFGEDYNFEKINDDECRFKNDKYNFTTPVPSLDGDHQIINAGASIAALLYQNRLKISEQSIIDGIKNTFWRARMQCLNYTKIHDLVDKDTELYLDGGHNEGAARIIRDWIIKKDKKEKRHNIIIIGMLERKDEITFIKIIDNFFNDAIIVSNNNDSYIDGEIFKREFIENTNINVFDVCSNIEEALVNTKSIKSDIKKRILICGSLHFAGDVLSLIEGYEVK